MNQVGAPPNPKAPAVSIVIPVYDKEAYLPACLKSALAQTLTSIEVVAVDDGSTDGSAAILRMAAEADLRLRVITQENRGLSGARNTGIRAARGEWILFHDADDILQPEAAEKLLRAARNDGVDIAGGLFLRDSPRGPRPDRLFRRWQRAIDFRTDPDAAALHYANFSCCNKIYRADFLRDNALEFTEGMYMQDIEFWMRCMWTAKSFTQTPFEVSHYVAVAGSWSRTRTKARFNDCFRLADRLDEFFAAPERAAGRPAKNWALIQGALFFFIKWKLDDFAKTGATADLDRLRELLLRIPEEDVAGYYNCSALAGGRAHMFLRRALAVLRLQRGDYGGAHAIANGEGTVGLPDTLPERVSGPEELELLISAPRGGVAAQRTTGRESGKHILVFGLGDLYGLGGVQLSYSWLFTHLCGLGHRITFYSHRPKPEDAKLYYALPEKVAIEHYRLAPNNAGRKVVLDIVRKQDPDVVLVVNSSQIAMTITTALYDHEWPVVFSERGGADHCLHHTWGTLRQRHLAHFCADFSHMLMPSYREALPAWLQPQLAIISSLTQPGSHFADPGVPQENGRYRILYTGRLSFEKDMDIALRAFAMIQDRFPDWDFDIYGDGPDVDALTTLIGELGIVDRARLRGSLPSMKEVYAEYPRSNLFVLPSRSEGCPLSLREAMAHGLPVIGFDSCSGTNEIIAHGRNGILVGAADKVGNLASALAELMAQPERRRELGRNGIEDVKRFDPDVVHGQWHELLMEAAKWKGRRRELRALRDREHRMERRRATQQIEHLKAFDAVRFLYLHNEPTWRDTIRLRLNGGDYALLFGSPLFDPTYYLNANFVVKKTGQDPLLHYLTVGWKKRLRPSEAFDPEAYCDEYMAGNMAACPLVHFYRVGLDRGACFPAPGTDEMKRAFRAEQRWIEDKLRKGGAPSLGQVVAQLGAAPLWKRSS